MRTSRTLLIPVLSLFLLAQVTIVITGAGAAEHMPPRINYQGHLTDTEGNPLAGPHNFIFRFYDAPEGGNLLWTEDHPGVTVTDGLLEVVLGSTNEITPDIITPPASPTASFFDVYIDITVDGEALQPRTLLMSTPYSLMTQRIDGDITTAPGSVSMIDQVGLNYQKIKWAVGGGESSGEMEASDGFGVTKTYDKASPQLFQSVAKKKSTSGSDSLLFMRLIESDSIRFSMAATDGVGTTSKIDKASPKLFEALVSSGEGLSFAKKTDQASPILFQSTVESGDGLSLTKAYDKATPILFQSSMESGEGVSITKRIDKASPLLYESTVESTDGVTISKEYDKATPQLAMLGAHYMDIEDADVGDSAMITIAASAAGVSMKQAIQDGDAALQAQLNASTLPTEEVSLRMTSSGGSLPTEEICVSTGPGSDAAGMWMFSTSSLTPAEGPADTNVQLYASAEGGSLTVVNVGGTTGDGLRMTVTDAKNTLRLRHGGANTGILLEADAVTGGKLGVNNEAPSEALSVSGNICASGTIGVCSDVRFKKDVEAIGGALATVTRLRGVRFSWKREQYPQQRFSDRAQVGFVAQEILDVVPEVVSQGADGYYSVDYGKLAPLLVEAVKELRLENQALRRRLEVLEQVGR